MNPTATVLIALLLVCLLPARRGPTLRTDVVETTVLPGVTYRIERHWRLAQADAEEQSEDAFAEMRKFRSTYSRRVSGPGSRWISTTIRDARTAITNYCSDFSLRHQLSDFYRTVPSNWHLSDFGISRNGKALPLTPEVAAALWQSLALVDAEDRTWPMYWDFPDPTECAIELEPVALRLDGYRTMAAKREEYALYPPLGISAIGDIECVSVRPYTVFIKAGKVIGIIGGDGRFDHIPDELSYLR